MLWLNLAAMAAYTGAMSNIPRLYLDHDLLAGAAIALADGQGKYLTRVMRLADGATVRVFNGRSGEWRGALRVDGKRVSIEPIEQTRAQYEALDLTLMFAPLKKTRTDFVVEKACELGVKQIWPVITEYTQTGRVRADKLRAVVFEAAEQTERMDVPDVAEGQPLANALSQWSPDKPLYYCDEAGEAKALREVLESESRRAAGFLIGPEGGFSPREREMLRSLDFVIPVTLGPRILRAETAVVSALTLWQSEVGDWRNPPYLPES